MEFQPLFLGTMGILQDGAMALHGDAVSVGKKNARAGREVHASVRGREAGRLARRKLVEGVSHRAFTPCNQGPHLTVARRGPPSFHAGTIWAQVTICQNMAVTVLYVPYTFDSSTLGVDTLRSQLRWYN